MKPTDQAFNSNTLCHFNFSVYHNVVTEDDVMGDEIAVPLTTGSDRHPGYVLKSGLKRFFLRTEDVELLPIRVKGTYRIIDGKNVYHVVNNFSSVSVKGEDSMSFRKLIDSFCPFIHTEPDQWVVWKIICVGAYVSRINFRLATNQGFGKNSVADSLRDLTNNVARIDKATFAKLEYVLRFPFIVCNEVAGLSANEKKEFESFGLSAGDFSNKYTKRSRKSHGTKEIYDISKLSLGFTYNNKEFYERVKREGFDATFPEQFLDRFLPLKMTGFLDVKQFSREGERNYEKEMQENMKLYQDLVRKLVHLMEHPPLERFHVDYDFGNRGRYERSFQSICLFISLYAKDKDEFIKLSNVLWKCYQAYLNTELCEYEPLLVEEERVE